MNNNFKIPQGTTHFYPANETDYDQTPSFLKRTYLFTGPESGKDFYGWFNWHQNDWRKDTSFSNRLDKLKPINEFDSFYGNERAGALKSQDSASTPTLDTTGSINIPTAPDSPTGPATVVPAKFKP